MRTPDFSCRLDIPRTNKLLARHRLLQDGGAIRLQFGNLKKETAKIPMLLKIGRDLDSDFASYSLTYVLTAGTTGTNGWRTCTVRIEGQDSLPAEEDGTRPFTLSVVATGRKLRVASKELTLHVPADRRAQITLEGVDRKFDSDTDFPIELQCRHLRASDKIRHFLEWQYQLVYGPSVVSFDTEKMQYVCSETWVGRKGAKSKGPYRLSTAGFRNHKGTVCSPLVAQFLGYWFNYCQNYKDAGGSMDDIVDRYDDHLLQKETGRARDWNPHQFMRHLHAQDESGESADGDVYYCSKQGHSWLVIKLAGEYVVPKKYIYGWGENADLALGGPKGDLAANLAKVIDYSGDGAAASALTSLASGSSLPSWYEEDCEPGWYKIQAAAPLPLGYLFGSKLAPSAFRTKFIENGSARLKAKALPRPAELSNANRMFGYYFRILSKEALLQGLEDQLAAAEGMIAGGGYPEKQERVKAFGGTPLVWCNARMRLGEPEPNARGIPKRFCQVSYQLADNGDDIWVRDSPKQLAWYKARRIDEATGWLDLTRYPTAMQTDALERLARNDCRPFGWR